MSGSSSSSSLLRGGSRRRWAGVALVVLVPVAVLAAACTPLPTGPTTTTTTSTTTSTTVAPRDVFCEVWAQRLAELDPKSLPEGVEPPVGPVRPFAYLLDVDTVVTAREVSAAGSDCKDPDARLTFLDGSIVSDQQFRPKNNFPPDGPNGPQPRAYPLTLEAGRAQAPSIEIASFNIQLSPQGIRIYGTLAVTINGARSIIAFDGRFQDLQNFKVTLSTTSLVIPGFTVDPLEATGTLERKAGLNSLALSLKAPDLQIGNLSVRDVTADLRATTTTGIELALAGQVRTVDSFVGLRLDAAFDSAGRLRDIDGRLDVDVASTTTSGEPVRLTGQATLTGSATNLTAAFLGSASIGTDDYAQVGGTIALDDSGLLQLDGFFDLVRGPTTTRFAGTLTIDPSGATPVLKASAVGSFSGLTSTGEIVEIDGNVTVTVVGGVTETTVDGSLRVGALRGAATAAVTVAGPTTTLDLTGEVELNGGKAAVAGRLVLTGGQVQLVDLVGTVQGSIPLGKAELAGALRVRGDARGLSASIDGTFVSDGVDVAGSLALQLGPAGDVLAARGSVSGRIDDGSYGASSFLATLVADADSAVLTGEGDLVGAGVNRGRVSAVVTVDGGGVRLDATGQAYVTSGSRTVFGDLRIVANRLELARVGLVYPPIVLDPEFLWVRLTMDPSGRCTQVQLLDATFLAGILFGINQAKADLSCP